MKRQPIDTGPKERWQHSDETLVEAAEDAGQTRVVVLTQDALDRYYRRSQLDPRNKERNVRLYDAGCQLRMDWTKAGLNARVISRYSDMVGNGSIQGFVATCEDAYKRMRRAIKAVGPVASDEVIECCCMGQPVGEGVRMEILRRGLDQLAKHYGY